MSFALNDALYSCELLYGSEASVIVGSILFLAVGCWGRMGACSIL